MITETGGIKQQNINKSSNSSANINNDKSFLQIQSFKKNLDNFEHLENKHAIISKLDTKKD